MAIRLLKVITGEEVIADVEFEKGIYTLKNPVRVIMSRDGSAGIVPWSFCAKGDVFTLRYDHVLFSTEVDDDIYNHYNAEYGSGLVMASQMPSPEKISALQLP